MVGGRLEDLGQHVPTGKIIIISDRNVLKYHHQKFPACDVIAIGMGEQIKTLETVEYIIGRLLELGADRSTFLVGIGGGIVCDITGFTASIFMRGIRFGFVSSSLLSQVDASVGGKNGVNHSGYKNMIGVFNQPDFVICDIGLLETLPDNEIRNGLAEMIKHGLILDKGHFEDIETHKNMILNHDREFMEKIIFDSINIKASIVRRDDEGERGTKKTQFRPHFRTRDREDNRGIPWRGRKRRHDDGILYFGGDRIPG